MTYGGSAVETKRRLMVKKSDGPRTYHALTSNQMNHLTLASLICIAAFLILPPAHAQEKNVFPERTVRIVLTDGSILIGLIERDDEAEIVLRSASGVVTTIPREQVKSLTTLDGERFFRTDPNGTRLFFAPTGRAVGAGAGYVAFYEVLVPFVAVGAGSAVTLAGGMTINPGTERFAYLAPKVTLFDRPTMSFALGGIGVTVLGATDSESVGLVYGVGTFGPPHASFTAGVAFGFGGGEISERPVLMLGGEYQMSNNVKLLTENYVFVGVKDGLLVSGGIRFFGDKLAADIGLFTVPSLITDEPGFPFIPWLGFAYNFGD